MEINLIIAGIVGLVLGVGGGFAIFRPKSQKIEEKARHEAKRIHHTAQQEAEKLLSDARHQAQKTRHSLQDEENESRKRIHHMQQQADERIAKREGMLEQRMEKADAQKEKYESALKNYEAQKQILQKKTDEQDQVLASLSKLSKEDAKKELLKRMETEVSDQLTDTLRRRVELMREKADEEANEVLIRSIQRQASTTTVENTTSVVKIDSEELKGKIIGKEGRNINAFEMLTGVDVIIDDSPGTITLSCFDMFRRYVAKVALERLVKDGRINPSRIEESIRDAERSTDKLILEIGQKAAQDLDMDRLPDPVLKLLGRLRFRTSYGQNVLDHSKEVGWLAESIANQIPGADSDICRKAGLLHDIGKAVSHEVEGGHAVIGKDILEKFGIDERIVTAMKSHHEDFPYESIEARIIQAADAISASRPGARRETLEKYIKRLKELESIAGSFKGVEKSFAIQAGREVRVFVNAKELDDLKSKKLSFDIARKLEKECQYPGEVQVTVIRENRFEEVAR